MPSKLFFLTTVVALLRLGSLPPFSIEMSAAQLPAPSETQRSQQSLDAEMTSHQNEMKALTRKLDESFQAIADARDAKGYVRDKSIIKMHEEDIKALRNAVRDHKLFLTGYEQLCGVNSKQQDAMIQHQQQMKGVLYDVVDTFDTYEMTNDAPNNPNYVPIEDIGPAFAAHREALKELTGAIAQHEQAMTQMMKKCS
jgi:hypothetical protein